MWVGTEDTVLEASALTRKQLPVNFEDIRGKSILGHISDDVDQRILESQAKGLTSGHVARCEWITKLPLESKTGTIGHFVSQLTIFKNETSKYLLVSEAKSIGESEFEAFKTAHDGYVRTTLFDDIVEFDG